MERKISNGNDLYASWLENYKQRSQEPPKSIETGISIIDIRLGGGFQREQLGIIGGLPGTGKTSFVLQVAHNIAKQGYKVIIYEYEMSADSLIERMIARDNHVILSDLMKGSVDIGNLRMPDSLENIYFADATCNLTATNIIDDIQAVITSESLPPVIIVDYLQKLPNLKGGGNGDVRITINDNLTILKSLAVQTKGLVLAISSMNRESAKNGDISMTAFRESSDIEYSADVLISMGTAIQKKNQNSKQLEWVEAKSDELQEIREETNVKVKFNFLKVRHYREGSCLLNFYRNFQNFAPFVAEDKTGMNADDYWKKISQQSKN